MVESVAENTSDAVVAPLVLGAVLGVPGLLGYRAANTLDAMVGHRNARYSDFGWASARLDDLLNLPGSRLTALLAALLGPAPALPSPPGLATPPPIPPRTPARSRPPSPARWASGSAGRTRYGDRVEHRAVLGSGRAPNVADIERAITLARRVDLAAAVICALLALHRRRPFLKAT